jgi:hypothetical protein
MIYLAAIKLEWWPGSDWNRWPPSSESAPFQPNSGDYSPNFVANSYGRAP